MVFVAVGYLLGRKEILPKESAKTLSTVGTYVFLPAYLINNLSQNFTVEKLSTDLPLFLWGILFLVCSVAVGFAVARIFKKCAIPKNTLIYIFAFSNYGYFGYPVMEGVFGEEFVSKTIVFALCTSTAISSYGYFLLVGKGNSFVKTLLSPPIVASVLGIILGIIGVKIPDAVAGVMSSASACMSPVSMLLTGFVLGRLRIKELFVSPISYVIALVRVAALPLFTAAVLLFVGARGYLFAIPVIITAMPIGMNTVLFPESAGQDSTNNARACFMSYLFSIISVPLAFMLASAFYG